MVHWRHERSTRWVESAVGVNVASCEFLVGGMSSEMRRFRLADGSAIVVRHITDSAWLKQDPDLIRREARALELLADSTVPTPKLIESNPEEGLLAMSSLPGTIRHTAAELRASTDALADLAAVVAGFDLPDDHGLPAWSSWAPTHTTPPNWGDRGLWHECLAAYHASKPPQPNKPVLLHRDYHPLNVLWAGPSVVGLVDWVNACVGHPHAELAHCRWNLSVLVGVGAADSFLERYLTVTGSGPYDSWWDLATVVGLLPGQIGTSGWNQVGRVDLTSEAATSTTETYLRSILNTP